MSCPPDRPVRPFPRQKRHDVKGILNAVKLHLALLRRAAAGELGEGDELRRRQGEWLAVIGEQMDKLEDALEPLIGRPAEEAGDG